MRDRSPSLASLIVSCALLIANSAPAAAQLSWRPLWLAVELNGVAQPPTIVILADGGKLWVERSAVDAWRLARSQMLPPSEFLGRMYYPFDQIADSSRLQWRIDQRRQALIVTATASAFTSTALSVELQIEDAPMQVMPGAFFNYDITAARIRSGHTESGLFELGMFRGTWTATQTAAGLATVTSAQLRRLDSAVSADFPERRATLTIGDAISTAGQWGRAVRYAGVQWATNFGTRPELLTFPLPTLSGDAAVPSTIDVFLNGALLTSREVPAGPFTITELPAVAGNGQLTARVRDLFGREHFLTQSFYAAPELLRSGLAAYSFEAGAQRTDYGLDDGAYGDPFAQATWQYGLTDHTTTELRVETLAEQTTAGFSLARSILQAGVVHGSIAGSHAHHGEFGRDGLFYQAGFDFSGRRLNVGARASLADRSFRQLGRTTSTSSEKVEWAVHTGCNLQRFGSLAAAYVERTSVFGHEVAFINASYSRELGRWAFLSLSVTHDVHANEQPGVFASITQPLGRGRSMQYAAHSREHELGLRTELHRSRRGGTGLSYHVAGESGSTRLVSGEGEWQGRTGTVAMGIAHRDGVTGLRATASGGIGLLGGDLYRLRYIEDNFAVVEVPQQAAVPIYLDNQLVGRTDAAGRVAISGLRPYERNRISVDPVALPLSVSIVEANVDAIPNGRGGILVRMPVQATQGVLIRLLSPDGIPVPAGARLELNGRQYPVAYEGRVYINELGEGGRAQARWAEGECEARVDVLSSRSLMNATDVVCLPSPMAPGGKR